MFKEKIITALKTKYQRFGLSNEAVDRIASAREKTVTNEEEIETAVADAETMELIANELQRSADIERRNRSTIQKSFEEYKEKHPESAAADPAQEPAESEPEWARALREENKRIAAMFARQEDEAKRAATLASVRAKLKEGLKGEKFEPNEGIVNSVLKGFALKENETEDAAVTRLKGEYAVVFKETFGDGPKPAFGTGVLGDDPKKAAEAKNEYLRREGLLPPKEK